MSSREVRASTTFMAVPMAWAGGLIVLLVLLIGLFIPHLRSVTWNNRWAFPATVAALALFCFVIAGFKSGFDKDHRQSNHLLYGLNADIQEAVWASADTQGDEWTGQFFASGSSQGTLADFFPLSRRVYRKAAAPAGSFAGPEVKVLEDTTENGMRRLRLRILSPRGAARLSGQTQSAVSSAALDGKQLIRNSFDGPSNLLGFIYFALPQEGIELALETKPSQPITLRVVDESYGLPTLPGATYRSRPEHMMPAPLLRTDCILVGKSYTF